MGIFEFPEEEIEPNTESQDWEGIFDFDDHLLFGYFFKDIVTIMLDKAGYEVYPYGYETFLPSLKRRLYESQTSDVAGRIRFTPDLLLRNSDSGEVYLVEIKARSASGRRGIIIKEIQQYLEFWPESIIVLVVPSGNCFYAQYAEQLDLSGKYYPEDEFCLLEDIFPLVKSLPKDFRRKMVLKARTLFRNRDYANL